MSANSAKPLKCRFIDLEADVRLELSNDTDHALKSVEILTVFLKDLETPGGGPSHAHIRFDGVGSIRPKENVVLSHKTWVNGKIASAGADLLARLKVVAGHVTPLCPGYFVGGFGRQDTFSADPGWTLSSANTQPWLSCLPSMRVAPAGCD